MMSEVLYPVSELPSQYNSEPMVAWCIGSDPRTVLYESIPIAKAAAVSAISVPFVYNDGGRKVSGRSGHTGDCVARAVAIASGRPYAEVYARLADGNATQRRSKRERRSTKRTGRRTASHGIFTRRKWFDDYMHELGFEWKATMAIGSGCKVHLRPDELPSGRIIVSVSKHMVAVIDGIINDTYDCSRGGTRCVYGYYFKP